MLCAPSNRRRPFWYHTKMAAFECSFSRETELAQTQESVLNISSIDSQIDKPQHGCPKRAELSGVNINTGAQALILRAKN